MNNVDSQGFRSEAVGLKVFDTDQDKNLTDEKLKEIFKENINLEDVTLVRSEKITVNSLAELSGLTNLQKLTLEGFNDIVTIFNNPNISSSNDKIKYTNLKELFIEKSYINDIAVKCFTQCIELHTLYLRSRFITDSSLGYLNQLKNLRILHLSGCERITDDGLKSLSIISNLEVLNLCYCPLISDLGLTFLGNLKKLRDLNIGGNYKITDVGLKSISQLKNLNRLDLFDLVKITNEGLKHLNNLENLQSLILYGCCLIGDDTKKGEDHNNSKFIHMITSAFEEESDLINETKSLELPKDRVVRDSLSYLNKLSKLTEISLFNCVSITDHTIKELIQFNNLQDVDLGHSSITNDSLSSLRQLEKLWRLNLACCHEISDEGIKHLAEHPNLQDLNVEYCQKITDKSLEFLISIPKLKNLNIKAIKFTENKIEDLKKRDVILKY